MSACPISSRRGRPADGRPLPRLGTREQGVEPVILSRRWPPIRTVALDSGWRRLLPGRRPGGPRGRPLQIPARRRRGQNLPRPRFTFPAAGRPRTLPWSWPPENYAWQHDGSRRPPSSLDDLVIYELHVGTFTPEGHLPRGHRQAGRPGRPRRDGHRTDAAGRFPGPLELGLRRRVPLRALPVATGSRTTCAPSWTPPTRGASR